MTDTYETETYEHPQCGLPIMLAALAEVGIDADGRGGDRIFQRNSIDGWHAPLCIIPLAYDSDPRVHWKAACVARRSVEIEEITWADWMHLVQEASSQGKRWLEIWGCLGRQA